MKLVDRFIRYVKVYTTSDPESDTVPTTSRQLDLAKILCEDLKEIGISDVHISEYGYVYGSIPATPGCESAPALGLIAHMDTAPAFSGENVDPQLIPDYDGGRVVLGKSGRELDPEMFPWLSSLKGRTLITTDGTTLLGADDKAGVTAIICALETILKENRPHGKLCVGFTPDEEVGKGPDHFDVKGFGADYAYTLDGGPENEISFDNFNAAAAVVKIKGFSIHPGEAKGKMINAARIAGEFDSILPQEMRPEYTEGYDGFFHLTKLVGGVTSAEMQYLVRDHDAALFQKKKDLLKIAADMINAKYGNVLKLEIKDAYRNMRELVEPHMYLIDDAKAAFKACDVEPKVIAIRGGTDGAQLSYKGLPCPNLSTGGHNFHSNQEYIPVQSLEKMVDVLVEIARVK